MSDEPPPSFSAGHKWLFSLNLLLTFAGIVALLVMINYLAARHFLRFDYSAAHTSELSPLTQRLLDSLTNEVKVIIYFDRSENPSLYPAVWGLLKEFQFRNPRVSVETVDYVDQPARATEIKARHKLESGSEKDLVIFESNGRVRFVERKQLSDYDLSNLMGGQNQEVKRTHFRGEMEFSSAILSVTNPRQLKAYFLQGHGEHQPESDDGLMGYSSFAAMLRENNVQFGPLTLGAADVPADCSLLIIAGPASALLPEELEKIDRYLQQGGRLWALFNYLTLNQPTGLEAVLGKWGVAVGNNVVREGRDFTLSGNDVLVSRYGNHPITRPFYNSRLYLVLPRTIAKAQARGSGADAPQVEPLAVSSELARVITDIRRGGAMQQSPADYIGNVPLMAAVERGAIPGVLAARGATRMVVTGDSIFLGNETIAKLANRDFASHVVNWLLARNELLGTLGPRPVKEYKLLMTEGQLRTVRWILLAGMPGSVLLLGTLVWLRRRR